MWKPIRRQDQFAANAICAATVQSMVMAAPIVALDSARDASATTRSGPDIADQHHVLLMADNGRRTSADGLRKSWNTIYLVPHAKPWNDAICTRRRSGKSGVIGAKDQKGYSLSAIRKKRSWKHE
jgi:hypothetical protein